MPAKPLTSEQLADAARLKAVFDRVKESNPSVTQEYVAEACGWKTQGTVSQYMNGKIPLNLSALFKFCDVFDVHPQDISPSLALECQPDWILHGKSQKLLAGDSIAPQPRQRSLSDDQQLTKLEKQLIEHLRQLESKEQRAFTLKIVAAANLRKALLELEQEDKGVANG